MHENAFAAWGAASSVPPDPLSGFGGRKGVGKEKEGKAKKGE